MAHRHVELGLKLPQLQNLMKRDPAGYLEDFVTQKKHFDSQLQIFLLKPNKKSQHFNELVTFLGHVSSCYREEAKGFPPQIVGLLERHAGVLDPELRRTCVQTLILLKNRGMQDGGELISLAFRLFKVPDKALRKLLKEHIISDVRHSNQKGRDERLNRSLLSQIDALLADGGDSDVAAKKGLDIAIDLYRKRVWTDARTVNMVGRALLHANPRIFVTAHNFFLGIDRLMADDEEEEEREDAEAHGLQTSGAPIDRRTGGVTIHNHSKKTSKRLRRVESAKKKVKIARRKLLDGRGEVVVEPRWPAITLLHDPQGLSERLFRKLRGSREKFKTRMLMMNLLSRLVGHHKLLLLSLYAFLQRYVTGHQTEVTHVLAFLVQATHELVPPEDLLPPMKAIANAFVADRCPPEAIALGINTMTQMCSRHPAVLREDGMEDFVQDICMYQKSRDRSVTMAARSFTNMVRFHHPLLLKRKDRGKFHNPSDVPLAYGEQRVVSQVPGLDLLRLEREGLLRVDEYGEVLFGDMEGEEEEEEEEEVPQLMDAEGGDGGGEAEDGEDEEAGEEGEEAAGEEGGDEGEGDSGADSDGEDSDGEEDGGQAGEEDGAAAAGGGVDELLSTEEFERIAFLRSAVSEALSDPGFRSKLGTDAFAALSSALKGTDNYGHGAEDSDESDREEVEELSGAVTAEDLAGARVKRRKSLQERVESILKGRESFNHQTHAGGLTNREKARKKNFLMVRKGRSMAMKLQNAARLVRRRQDGNVKKTLKRDQRKRRRT